ncbi:Type I restriction-modification system, restriction subunit R [hydrothermal vent metagenome]|uniref:Type I restriction-modification system, restriction subunit R n=1 Tax=hydrothermal vent metagenome TaxID=652676 RepID=A0A3B1B4N1_9ZZZZ
MCWSIAVRSWEARYYQHNAINKTLESIVAGEYRILLTQVIGAGKTFIAFALPPVTWTERVLRHKGEIFSHYDYKQQQFLDFVLAHYVDEGVGELAQEKLPDLLELKYHGVSDAAEELGKCGRDTRGFCRLSAVFI